jgi:hypothetical protein
MKTKPKRETDKTYNQLKEQLKKVTKQRQEEMTLLKTLVAQQQQHY